MQVADATSTGAVIMAQVGPEFPPGLGVWRGVIPCFASSVASSPFSREGTGDTIAGAREATPVPCRPRDPA